MATKKHDILDADKVQAALIVIQQLYKDYSPDEITEAFRRNRQEITAQEEQASIQAQIAQLTESLDKLN